MDATIIEAMSSTKNRAGERNPEIHQIRKGYQWHFGMKAHIGLDSETGIVHSMSTFGRGNSAWDRIRTNVWWWTMGKSEALPTIWEIPDHLWEQIHPMILDLDSPKGTGRKRADRRRMLDGIWAVLVEGSMSGAEWTGNGSRRTVPWARLVLGAPLDATPPARQSREQEEHLGRRGGWPPERGGARANVHDTKLLRPALKSIVVELPEGAQNLCLDKG